MLVDNFANRLNKAISIRNIKPSEIVKQSEFLYKNGKINKALTKPLLSNYQKGNYEAKQDNIYALSLILNVDEAWLMGADVPMEKHLNRNFTEIDKANFVKIPVVGKISAGKPILVEEYIEGYLPVDPNIYGLKTADDLFYLKVSGQSMNMKIKNEDYALIRKQNTAEDGDIVVAIVNSDDEATLKRFKKLNEQFILLGYNI